MVFVKKMAIFDLMFFLWKMSKKKLFLDILERKECFLDKKN